MTGNRTYTSYGAYTSSFFVRSLALLAIYSHPFPSSVTSVRIAAIHAG